jgi:NAD(P)-dependent dehydrogenase (short-subunit alcohol dehydrogenase family)
MSTNVPEINLTGRKVQVTGGACGLGEAFARALVAAGSSVAISDVLHASGMALTDELGSRAFYVPIDLSDAAAIKSGVVAAAHHLPVSGQGREVNLASDTALWGATNLMAYVASKGAAMTHAMARGLGPQGLTVNAIAPGLTLLEATSYVPQVRHDHYRHGRAIQRPQVPEDLTSAVLFLLSRGSGYITGQVLPINGGFVMQ